MNLRIQLLTTLFLLIMVSGFAQSRIAKPTNRKATLDRPKSDVQFRQEQDTVFYAAAAEECGNLVTSYEVSETWGFVAGTNGYEDLEKAQRLVYTANSPYTVKEVWGFFAYAKTVGDGPLRVKIYSVDEDSGGPGELLGESEDIQTSDIVLDTIGVLPTIFQVNDMVTLTDSAFFVSLDLSDLYAAGDTVALFMTNDTCGRGEDTWELFGDGTTWLPINDRNSWQLNANWVMAAVVEFDETTSVNDPFVAQKGLRIFPATPNPTNTWVNLPFELETSSTVNIEVYSADGKRLQHLSLGQRLPGNHTERIDVQSLPPGTYMYSILTDNARLMSRFVVSH